MSSFQPQMLAALCVACSRTRGSVARGSALEDLVEYLFTCVPSVQLYERDVKDDSGAQEIDLVFSHYQSISLLPMPDVTAIVECKNERRKTSSDQVRSFGSKLRSRSLSVGILVTASGLSGSKRTHAHSSIRDELGLGVSIIVATLEDLCKITSMPDDFSRLLTERINELRTHRTYLSI